MIQLIQQKRAQYALNKVDRFKQSYPEAQKNFKSYSRSLPTMIHTNGLGQAIAFCHVRMGSEPDVSKKNNQEKAYYALYYLLEEWLFKEGQPYEGSLHPSTPHALLTKITQSDMQTYRLAQAEAQALLSWVKKFAEAFLEGEVSQDDGGVS